MTRLETVIVVDENTTELEFEASSALSTGDLITLGSNFLCGPGQSINAGGLAHRGKRGCCAARCATRRGSRCCGRGGLELRKAVVQGRYSLGDRLDNHNSAPNEYISGHKVTLHPTDSQKVGCMKPESYVRSLSRWVGLIPSPSGGPRPLRCLWNARLKPAHMI